MENCANRCCLNGRASGAPREKKAISGVAGLRGGVEVLRACSACAGDYEDPDRSVAWTSEDRVYERGDARDVDAEEFPAEK